MKGSARCGAFRISEHENDGLYWEPTRDDDLRQGDLLFNVPTALMPQLETPEAQAGKSGPRRGLWVYLPPTYVENTEARFGVLGMIVTPTCHVSQDEKDGDIVAVVPVEALNLAFPRSPSTREVTLRDSGPRLMIQL